MNRPIQFRWLRWVHRLLPCNLFGWIRLWISSMVFLPQVIQRGLHQLQKLHHVKNTWRYATSMVPGGAATTWSSTTNSTTLRKPTAASWITMKTSSVTSSMNAATLKICEQSRWPLRPLTLCRKRFMCDYQISRYYNELRSLCSPIHFRIKGFSAREGSFCV